MDSSSFQLFFAVSCHFCHVAALLTFVFLFVCIFNSLPVIAFFSFFLFAYILEKQEYQISGGIGSRVIISVMNQQNTDECLQAVTFVVFFIFYSTNFPQFSFHLL